MDFYKKFRVKPGSKIKLSNWDPAERGGLDKITAKELLAENIAATRELQERLYSENKRALLIVLQGMDAAGKDGTIRSIMTGINPQGCHIASFKKPSVEELDHDFLWRIHQEVPARGCIGIFNRSHYEDVLIVRVHKWISKSVCEERYEMINDFERMLQSNGTEIVKFYLHIDKAEQKERFQARLDEPGKNWKFNPGDLSERKHWDDYMGEFENVLENCSTEPAPWFVIPANRKWFRNMAISTIIRKKLEEMNPKNPKADFDPSTIIIED